MQKKDHMVAKFCEFKECVKKDIGRKVKTLKSNNDSEYLSNEFKNFCAIEGVR